MPRVLLAIALLALIAVPIGCGSSGDQLPQDDYQQELDQASTGLTEASQALGTELSKGLAGQGSFEEAADEMSAVREQLDATADELDSVSPPEDSAAAHDRMVDALHAYSDDLADLQQALEDGDRSQITGVLNGVQSLDSVQELQQAGAALRKLGYEFET